MAKWSFRPDLDHTTPNIITAMNGLVPTSRGGWRNVPAVNTALWTGGASGSTNVNYNGSFFARSSAGTNRIFLAANHSTPNGRIWEATGTNTLTDRSKGANYTNNAFFTFCQLGDTTIAANKSDALQSATTGAFADTAGSPPKAKICVSDANQVMLLNYNDGTDTPDGWWCSDVGTTATWTPAATNEAANGRLRDFGGPITAGCSAPFGGVLAFKKSVCYIGEYVGQPEIRRWRLLSPDIGCPWVEGCLPVGDVVYFAHYNGVYMTDGSRVVDVSRDVKQKMRTFSLLTAPRVALKYDDHANVLYVYIGSSFSTNFTSYWALNLATGEWGTGTVYDALIGPINAPYKDILDFFSSVGGINAMWKSDSYSSPAYVKGLYASAGFDGAGVDYNASYTWTLSYQGDAKQATTVQQIIPVIGSVSIDPSATTYRVPADYTAFSVSVASYSYLPGGNTSGSATATMDGSGKFDLMTQGNWHQATYSVSMNNALSTGFEWFDQTAVFQAAGKR